jgi:virginiamycin B lyase
MIPRLLIALNLCLIAAGIGYAQDALPDGEGRDTVEYVCSQCHDLLPITSARKTPDQWRYVITTMINQGAPLEEYEVDTVVRYLAENFGQEETATP